MPLKAEGKHLVQCHLGEYLAPAYLKVASNYAFTHIQEGKSLTNRPGFFKSFKFYDQEFGSLWTRGLPEGVTLSFQKQSLFLFCAPQCSSDGGRNSFLAQESFGMELKATSPGSWNQGHEQWRSESVV